MNKPKITVIGSINMDLVTVTPTLPNVGETVLGSQFSTIPGGKGANQAVAAARLGADVTMIGCVGKDVFGQELLAHLKKEGVNIDNVEPVTHKETGTASITIANGDNSIIVVQGANNEVTSSFIKEKEELIATSDILLLQLEIPIETVEAAAKIAQQNGVRVILNPAPIQPLSQQLVNAVDFITPNEHELSVLLDQKERLETIKEKLVITKGAEGISYFDNGKEVTVPSFQVDVIDTTGAGDTFNGAFAVALSNDFSLEGACQFGAAAGALSVTKLGAQSGMPTLEELSNHWCLSPPEFCRKTLMTK